MQEPTVGIQFRALFSGRLLQEASKRLADLSRPLKSRGVAIVRNRVALEFLHRVWYMPGGGVRPWKPVKPFGNVAGEDGSLGPGKGGRRPLINTGAYFNALQGRGAGSITRVTAKTLVVGVDASMYPQAKYLRGGTGATIKVSDWITRPRARIATARKGRGSYVRMWKMWWLLGIKYGVWLSEATLRRGLRLTPRPHLTRHPELVRQMAALIQRWVSTGKVR